MYIYRQCSEVPVVGLPPHFEGGALALAPRVRSQRGVCGKRHGCGRAALAVALARAGRRCAGLRTADDRVKVRLHEAVAVEVVAHIKDVCHEMLQDGVLVLEEATNPPTGVELCDECQEALAGLVIILALFGGAYLVRQNSTVCLVVSTIAFDNRRIDR